MAESKKNIVKMAMIYAQEGRWDKAISEYKKLLTLDPTDYNTHNMLGDVYKKKGDDALAYQEYVVSAEAYLKQGLQDKANIVYKKIGMLDSNKLSENDRKKQIMIKKHTEAEKLIENGETDKAIAAYQDILKINPESFDTYQKLGELYAEKGDKEKALQHFEKIVDIYFKNRLYKKALPIYQKIMEIQPDKIEIREKIAEIYEREGSESDAKREYLYLAEYYYEKENIEKTDFYAQKAVEFKSIEAHFFKGAALYAKKEFGEAKKELEMLLKFKANHVGALATIIKLYNETGAKDQAAKAIEKLEKAEPNNPDTLEMVADVKMEEGNTKEAVEKYMACVDAHVKADKPEKGITVLNKVIEQDKENVELLEKLAELYEKSKKKKEAADTLIKLSDLFKKNGDEMKSIDYYKKAEETDPGNPEIVKRQKELVKPPAPPKKEAAPKPEPPKESPKEPLKEPEKSQELPKTSVSDLVGLPDLPVAGVKQEGTTVELPDPAAPPKPMPKEPPKTADPMSVKLPDAPLKIVQNQPMTQAKKPSEQIPDMPPPKPVEEKPVDQTKEDIPSLIAMADSYIQTGAFDEGIEMYQKAQSLDPGNAEIKEKLNKAYSQYAGLPPGGVASVPDIEKQKKEEEERKKKEEEKKKKEEEEKKKKEEEEKKKQEEAKKKQEELTKKMEEDKKKKEEEKKKQEEEKKKKEEEEKKKKAAEIDAQEEDEIDDSDIGADFATVTTADIFIKQGLMSEAEKILTKIIAKDGDNIEAKMKLEELKKMKDKSKKDDGDDKPGKGKQSKVSYI